ncbi:Vat family streptogramin A O-acetyltransferase [Virgibacillus oceani]|uniref:Vat family streptogramin A O-acetyltransferase n=1 Tax=Virgibacillus oceani TaxID=1479511 RepID=A0A917HHX6_9BACI|nr:Vat family streptogramin A O-acetyltransferase [Virgibacillus oceani]GGG79142.1 Vat family streptogramin A O-acetyltransferase [Virgibacillus oceani]
MESQNHLGPNPDEKYPIKGNNHVQFIKPFITKPNILVGEYSYYDSKNGESLEEQVLYHYEIIGDKLIIGKFCSIGPGTTFIMNGANHRMDGSTFPFNLFGNGWEKFTPTLKDLPYKGNTEIGNDVWIGREVTIMPGVKIGDGAIIGAKSVIAKNVEPYTIVAGNPSRVIKKRFSEEKVKNLLEIRWWDLTIEIINEHIDLILNGDVEKLKQNLRRDK